VLAAVHDSGALIETKRLAVEQAKAAKVALAHLGRVTGSAQPEIEAFCASGSCAKVEKRSESRPARTPEKECP